VWMRRKAGGWSVVHVRGTVHSGLLLDAFFVLSGATVLAAVDKRVILDIAQFAASAIAAFGVVLIYCEIRRRRRSG
jgi:hypothetical protein